LVGRTFDLNYRYGFNGKEHDTDTYGQGNVYDYGFRIYNPRLGKFLSVDPLLNSYPWYSSYQFAGNIPIKFIDLDGKQLDTYDLDPCVLCSIYYGVTNTISNGALAVHRMFRNEDKEGARIRSVLKENGFVISDNITNESLAASFETKVQGYGVETIFSNDNVSWTDYVDVGIAVISIYSILKPGPAGAGMLGITTKPLTTATIGEILSGLALRARKLEMQEWKDLTRDGNNFTEIQAEQGAIMERYFDGVLRPLKPGEVGDFAIESSKYLNTSGKTIDVMGPPQGAPYKLNQFYDSIESHVIKLQNGVGYIGVDIRAFNMDERVQVIKHLSQNYQQLLDEGKLIIITNSAY
jgi:RHS repeat-associated protein